MSLSSGLDWSRLVFVRNSSRLTESSLSIPQKFFPVKFVNLPSVWNAHHSFSLKHWLSLPGPSKDRDTCSVCSFWYGIHLACLLSKCSSFSTLASGVSDCVQVGDGKTLYLSTVPGSYNLIIFTINIGSYSLPENLSRTQTLISDSDFYLICQGTGLLMKEECIQQKQWIFSLLPGLLLKTVHEIPSSGKNIFYLQLFRRK